MGTSSIRRIGHTFGFARFGRSGAAISVLAGLLVAGGCASYANVPEPESPTSVTSPNRRQPKAVMKAALTRVLNQYPPGTSRYAVGLPEGVSLETIQEILTALGPGAELASAGTSDLPTYAIGRIWIRTGKSKVDIFRPVVELGRRADGTYERQAITVWLEGGLDPWHVTRTQRWAVGAFPRPDVADWPEAPLSEEPESLAAERVEEEARAPDTPQQPAVESEPVEATRPLPAEESQPERRAEVQDNGVIRIEPVND